MLTVSWQYVVLDRTIYTGHRVKRITSAPIPSFDAGVDTPLGPTWKKQATKELTFKGDRYVFAFWSITWSQLDGTARGADVETDRTATLTVDNGAFTARATAWFVWDFGGGPGQHGLFLDAFDQTIGDFVADDFVEVAPDDQTRPLSLAANNGFLPSNGPGSITSKVEVIPMSSIRHGRATFVRWIEVSELTIKASVGGDDRITLEPDGIMVAFGIYESWFQAPPRVYQGHGAVILGHEGGRVVVAPPGFPPPPPPGDPTWRQVLAGLNVYEAAAGIADTATRIQIERLALQHMAERIRELLKIAGARDS